MERVQSGTHSKKPLLAKSSCLQGLSRQKSPPEDINLPGLIRCSSRDLAIPKIRTEPQWWAHATAHWPKTRKKYPTCRVFNGETVTVFSLLKMGPFRKKNNNKKIKKNHRLI